MEVAYKTLVRPKLEYAAPIWSPCLKLQINQVEKVQRTAAPLDLQDGEIPVVSARYSMSLSGHRLRPVGIGPPCFSFMRYILVLCPYRKRHVYSIHGLFGTGGLECTVGLVCSSFFSPNYSTVEWSFSFGWSIPRLPLQK